MQTLNNVYYCGDINMELISIILIVWKFVTYLSFKFKLLIEKTEILKENVQKYFEINILFFCKKHYTSLALWM